VGKDIFLSRWARLYANPTDAERALEPAVAALGIPYRFQHPLWGLRVFPDFVLPRHKIVIEVDDPGHNRSAQRKKDAERTEKLNRAGWRVARCTNEEAEEDPHGAVRRMLGDTFVETCYAARDARQLGRHLEADLITENLETE
jgi:very-short-patch-repair endonuclease